MSFEELPWVALLPAYLWAIWRYPFLRSPLRITLGLLAILVLLGPKIDRKSGALDLWVLVDRSASAGAELTPRLAEWETLLSRSKPFNDRLLFVDFAEEAAVRSEYQTQEISTHAEETRLGLALHYALNQMKTDRSNRFLVFSDGYSTEPLRAVVERLLRENIPLDYRLLPTSQEGDYRIGSINLPSRVQESETFLLSVELQGNPDGPVPYEVWRNDKGIASGIAIIKKGRTLVRFTDRLALSGSHQYEVRIVPPKDKYPGNNSSKAWVDVAGPPSILLFSGYENDPLVPFLESMGLRVDLVTATTRPTLSSLQSARAVIFNNFPASRVSSEFLKGLEFYVHAQGRGLFMAGGKQSFGSGGYFGTSVDDLLPVSTEQREEIRKIPIALAIVLDRSGSMSAGVEGNMGTLTKMDLANEGTARTVTLMGSRDLVTISAVDSESHLIVPLTEAKASEETILSLTRSITSGGGGIFVYAGLHAAREELKNAGSTQKHIILFSDAADSEEPGAYAALLQEMQEEKTTVSVIGLGRESDPDADLLKEIAELGKGRIFFVSNAVDLPAVFAQETMAVARSTFVTDRTPFVAAPGWLELSSQNLRWPANIDGYNLNYLRPEGSAAGISGDQYKAPLIAVTQRGAGRTAAVSFPLAGDFSGEIRGWSEYGEFLQTLIRWLVGPELPPGIEILSEVQGRLLQLNLYYDQSWEKEIALHAPELLIDGLAAQATTLAWERIRPGQFQASIPLRSGAVVRGAVTIGTNIIPFGPATLFQSSEWSFDRARLRELQELSRLSGGSERRDLSKVWEVERDLSTLYLRPVLLVLLLVLFLLEALLTRLNRTFVLPAFSGWKLDFGSIKRLRRKPLVPQPLSPAEPSQPVESDNELSADINSEEKLRDQLARAKRRGV